MLNPKLMAQMDQVRAIATEAYPPMWWSLFDACLKQGFTRAEALELVKHQHSVSYMAAMQQPPRDFS